MTAYKPFVIVGMPRTGSTLLLTTIQQHPAVLSHGELFHPVVTERSGRHAIRLAGTALYFDEVGDPIEFLKQWLWKQNDPRYRAVGFKIFVEYLRARSTNRLLERLKDEIAGLHVVRIRRRNYFDVYVSRLVAQKTNRWISHATETSSGAALPDTRLMISHEAAAVFFRAMEQADAYIETLFGGDRYLAIDYEDLSQHIQEQANTVFRFLGVDRAPVEPAIEKQLIKRKEDIVVNYQELAQHFVGSPYESFFTIDESRGAAERDEEWGSNVLRADPGGVDGSPDSLELLDEAILKSVNEGLLPIHGPRAEGEALIFMASEPPGLDTLPKSLAAKGNLERVNGLQVEVDFVLSRIAPVRFAGWSCRMEHTEACADSRYVFLEHHADQTRYYAHLPSRIQRDDVADAAPEVQDWGTRFSGFDFIADLHNLPPGDYRLGLVHKTERVCDELVFANKLRMLT